MRLENDFESEKKNNGIVILTALGVFLFALVLLLAVIFFNRKETMDTEKEEYSAKAESSSEEGMFPQVIYPEADELIGTDSIRPEDLDFWDLYPEKTMEEESESEQESSEPEPELKPENDGRHTKIINDKGEEEWVLISPYLPKNSYDYLNLVNQGGFMKYCPEGRETSFSGVDLSQYQDYVDFNKVKKAGIDFVILKLGSRGYSTGQLLLDDYFVDNERRANDAGMDVGVYFFSQAISVEEAKEEADFVLENLKEKKITYPVALDMGKIENDTQRTDALTKSERTKIAAAFLTAIKEAGYKPILYGTKSFLIKEIDYSKLKDYDVWLSEKTDIPDYPYKFSMWQYSDRATVDGIAGYVNLDISFVDYREK